MSDLLWEENRRIGHPEGVRRSVRTRLGWIAGWCFIF